MAVPNDCPGEAVWLHVYDMTPHNKYTYPLGFGIFHTGVEIYGTEFVFGGHDLPGTGIFQMRPKAGVAGLILRKSIEVGRTTKSRQDVCDLVRRMSEEYRGQSYNILMRNCNHFSKDFVHQLSGAKFPGWINRLANFGAVFPCAAALPESTMMPAPPPISASNRTDATRKEAKSKEARACAGKGLRK